jgi:hypothetical protein
MTTIRGISLSGHSFLGARLPYKPLAIPAVLSYQSWNYAVQAAANLSGCLDENAKADNSGAHGSELDLEARQATIQGLRLYCQLRRYHTHNNAVRVQATCLLTRATMLLVEANELSIAAYVTHRGDLREQYRERRGQAVQCLAEMICIKARAGA